MYGSRKYSYTTPLKGTDVPGGEGGFNLSNFPRGI